MGSIICGLFAALVFSASAAATEIAADPARAWKRIARHTGSEVDAALGHAACVGDWNSDGRTDLAVSAFRGAELRGAVLVYTAGEWPPAEERIIGIQRRGHAGYSLGGSGDVNGDGIDDLLIGAPFSSPPSAVQIHLGSRDGLSETPDLVLYGDLMRDYFGYSVVAHDVNGDGWKDVVVGADDGARAIAGAVWTFHGGPELDTAADSVIEGGKYSTSNLGSDLASAGDLNGDGGVDLVIGDHDQRARFTDRRGRIFVTTGGRTTQIDGPGPDSWFSITLAPLGDWDLDGLADIAVAAPRYTVAGKGIVGWVGVLHGSRESLAIHDLRVGERRQGFFGAGLTGGADFTGDGVEDLVIGAPGVGGVGRIEVFPGGPGATLEQKPVGVFHGTRQGAAWGSCLTTGFDLDQDGRIELLVGAPEDCQAGYHAGAFELWERGGAEE